MDMDFRQDIRYGVGGRRRADEGAYEGTVRGYHSGQDGIAGEPVAGRKDTGREGCRTQAERTDGSLDEGNYYGTEGCDRGLHRWHAGREWDVSAVSVLGRGEGWDTDDEDDSG